MFKSFGKSFLFSFLIGLSGCTNAIPEITQLNAISGPTSLNMTRWTVTAPESSDTVEINGTCAPHDRQMFYSWDDGYSWIVVGMDELPAAINCHQATFSFEVPSPRQNATILLRTYTAGGYSESSVVEIILTY